MITIKNANNSIKRTVPTLEPEAIAIRSSIGRILAEDIVADMDLPPFDRSMMDGFAVRAADLAGPHSTLKVVGESAAGRGWHHELSRGEAVRIMTGAPVPKGADAVVRGEDTSENNGSVVIDTVVKRGTSIVKRGSEVRSGRILLHKGDRITPYNIATIAAFGYAELQVYKCPAISIISGTQCPPVNGGSSHSSASTDGRTRPSTARLSSQRGPPAPHRRAVPPRAATRRSQR